MKLIIIIFFMLSLVSTMTFNSASELGFMEEICDNAIDDDNDGLIDLNDPDCDCIVIKPESFIPNPSFEEISCCPSEPSQLYCATGWVQASLPTTDFMHTCGWDGGNINVLELAPPQPLPDGKGIVGFRNGLQSTQNNQFSEGANWKEYAGACLISPLKADSLYRIEFDLGFIDKDKSPPILITLFGTTDCSYLPFGGGEDDPLTGCPSNDPNWVELANVPVIGGENVWVKDIIEFSYSEDIAAVAIGPDCANNFNGTNRYYFLDNLVLDKIDNFQFNINTFSNPCNEDFLINVEFHPDVDYQWYKEGIALIGEINPSISKMYGDGSYQLRAIKEGDCYLSDIYEHNIPFINTTIFQTICQGDIYQFGNQILTEAGIYSDTLNTSDLCDSIITLELLVEDQTLDTIKTMIFDGETYSIENFNFTDEGEYNVSLTSESGCNVQTLIIIAYHNVYIPNAFSPNSDGINDKFIVQAKSDLIQSIEMKIYDRWGNLVHSGFEWDGTIKNNRINFGSFSYIIQVTLVDNSTQLFSGTVLVIK